MSRIESRFKGGSFPPTQGVYNSNEDNSIGLNIFPNPDRDIRSLPPSAYTIERRMQMSKEFRKYFDSLDKCDTPQGGE